MGFETAAQQAIFTALATLGCAVFDSAPGLPEGRPDSGFPYCVIGSDSMAPNDADDVLGASISVTLHFWSRSSGFKEVKALMGAAYDILHRGAITATGYKTVDCLWEFSDVSTGPDGKTRHGVQRYRITLHKE